MRSWFWPGVVTVAALTSLSLWFGANKIERDLASQLEAVTANYPWLQYSIEGRDVTLYGQAASEAAIEQLILQIEALPQINSVDNELTLLPLASPFKFQIEISQDEVLLSGAIPEAKNRDEFIQMAENNISGRFIDDQMSLSRGAPEYFVDAILHVMPMIAELKLGKIIISDEKITVDGDALDSNAYNKLMEALAKPLPGQFTYSGSFITRPQDS